MELKKMAKDTHAKEVRRSTNGTDTYLNVFNLIKEGKSPAGICSILNMKKTTLQHYIDVLRLRGYIKKVGYGVWEEVRTLTPSGLASHGGVFKEVRSHGFGFYLKIPKFYAWKRRTAYLTKEGIKFKIDNFKRGQQIELKDFHIWLYDTGIKFLQKKGSKSIYSNSATLGNELALRNILNLIRSLENLFKISLAFGKQYRIKITRQHHALIKNELANLYNKEGKKLKCFDEKGLWLLIDHSLNLDELETIRGTSAASDMDNAIKPFFNSLKEKPFTAYDFENLFNATTSLATNTNDYAKNIKLHLETLTEIKDAIKELKDVVKKQ